MLHKCDRGKFFAKLFVGLEKWEAFLIGMLQVLGSCEFGRYMVKLKLYNEKTDIIQRNKQF